MLTVQFTLFYISHLTLNVSRDFWYRARCFIHLLRMRYFIFLAWNLHQRFDVGIPQVTIAHGFILRQILFEYGLPSLYIAGKCAPQDMLKLGGRHALSWAQGAYLVWGDGLTCLDVLRPPQAAT